MKYRVLTTFSLLLGAACTHGEVEVEGLEEFGPVRGAVWSSTSDIEHFWTYSESTGLLTGGGGGATFGRLRIANEKLSCADLVEFTLSQEEAAATFLDAYAEGRHCEILPRFYEIQANAVAGTKTPSHSIDIYRREFDGEPWLEGTFMLQDLLYDQNIESGVDSFGGFLRYFTDPNSVQHDYLDAADSWNVEACAFDVDYWDSNDYYSNLYFGLFPGSLTVNKVVDGRRLEASIESSFKDKYGIEIGFLNAEFEADWCELPDVQDHLRIVP